ncbi:hypothetical protein [Novosphingobium resinovorum]|uniref:hypothetical protein n=1 Tax=Novosphingobium resinovorum TaxID=158500 RepID=UPI002ED2F6B2|nr:hypothetical protein [Novosphingobium resinovorum]
MTRRSGWALANCQGQVAVRSVLSVMVLAFSMCLSCAVEAAPETSTRLVSCGQDSCLLVSGRRADPASAVRINGHDVDVAGGRTWRVRLPLGIVRAWSMPVARTIEVTVLDSRSDVQATRRVRLPIGLLGHVTDLASLEIGVR